MKTIAVIGGKGAMGAQFARLFKKAGCKVLTADVKTKLTAQEACSKADVTIFSVPISITAKLIERVVPFAKKGSLLVDLTSIKSPAMIAFKKYSPRGCEILGLHPLFGPSMITNMKGQVIAATPLRARAQAKWLMQFLKKQGALVRTITPKAHDELMAVVQGITHFSSLASGLALMKLGASISKTRKFSSPIYELRLAMVGRILNQSARLYAEIEIENPATVKALRAYRTAIDELLTAVEKKDELAFCRLFEKAAKHFGPYRKQAYDLTDELIRFVTRD